MDEPEGEEIEVEETSSGENEEEFQGYDILEVDGDDLSGYRYPNVVGDIGFGERVYGARFAEVFIWAETQIRRDSANCLSINMNHLGWLLKFNYILFKYMVNLGEMQQIGRGYTIEKRFYSTADADCYICFEFS